LVALRTVSTSFPTVGSVVGQSLGEAVVDQVQGRRDDRAVPIEVPVRRDHVDGDAAPTERAFLVGRAA